MFAAQGLSVVLQFVAQVAAARILSLREMGVFVTALAISTLFAILQAVGLPAYLIRHKTYSAEVRSTAFTLNAGIAVALALLTTGAGVLFIQMFGTPDIGYALLGLSVPPILAAVAFLPLASLEREGGFRAIAVVTTCASLLGSSATLVGLFAGLSYMSVVVGQIAAGLATAALAAAVNGSHPVARLGLTEWRDVSRFAVQMFAVGGVSAIGVRVSDLALARLLGIEALALYSRASSLNGLFWNNVHLVVGRVLFVDFADILRRGESLKPRYLQTVDALTALLWPVFGAVMIVAGPIVVTLYGDKWAAAALPLTFLAASSILQISITMTWELFTVTDNLRVQTRVEFIRAGVGTLLFVLGSFISIGFAAFARVIESTLAVLLYRPHINRMTDARTREFTRIYARNALLSALTVGPMLAVMAINGWSAHSPLWALGLAAAAGAAIWLAAGLVLKQEIAVAVVRRLRRRV